MAIVGYVVLSPHGSQERCTSPAYSIGRDGHKMEEACPPLAQTEVSHPRWQGLSKPQGVDRSGCGASLVLGPGVSCLSLRLLMYKIRVEVVPSAKCGGEN